MLDDDAASASKARLAGALFEQLLEKDPLLGDKMKTCVESSTPAESKVEHDGEIAGEVDLTTFPWYKGSLSRDKAERMLSSAKEGTFLMRSSSRAAEPVVSFVHFGTIQHSRVKRNEKLMYILGGIGDSGCHASLREMFQHFSGSLLMYAL